MALKVKKLRNDFLPEQWKTKKESAKERKTLQVWGRVIPAVATRGRPCTPF